MHDRISHLHLDFTGVHGLVTTVSGENFYVNMKTCILKPIRRMKVFFLIFLILISLLILGNDCECCSLEF